MGYLSDCLFLAFAYWLWPDGIGNTPVSQLTLSTIGLAVMSASVAMMALSSFLSRLDSKR